MDTKITNALDKQDDIATMCNLLREIRDAERNEVKLAKRRSIMSLVISFACLGIMAFLAVAVFSLIPKIKPVLDDAGEVVEEVTDLIDDAQIAVKDLKTVSRQLSALDFEELFSDVNLLVENSTTSIEDAMEKLDKIDFAKLNEAIENFANVVKPLSSLFGH